MSKMINNVLIIEDEKPAAEKLASFIARYDSNISISGLTSSISASLDWLTNHQAEVDLIFMDIQLSDGPVFELYKQIRINAPVIFITAYHEYALEAFQSNGIAYLLKPLAYEAFTEAMDKWHSILQRSRSGNLIPDIDRIQQVLSNIEKRYQERFLVKVGEHLRSFRTSDIACFFAEGKYAFLWTIQGRKFNIDYKLELLEEKLNPKEFFRVNRSFIIHLDAIKDVLVYSNSRLKIMLEPMPEKEIIVSRDKVKIFKDWMRGL